MLKVVQHFSVKVKYKPTNLLLCLEGRKSELAIHFLLLLKRLTSGKALKSSESQPLAVSNSVINSEKNYSFHLNLLFSCSLSFFSMLWRINVFSVTICWIKRIPCFMCWGICFPLPSHFELLQLFISRDSSSLFLSFFIPPPPTLCYPLFPPSAPLRTRANILPQVDSKLTSEPFVVWRVDAPTPPHDSLLSTSRYCFTTRKRSTGIVS